MKGTRVTFICVALLSCLPGTAQGNLAIEADQLPFSELVRRLEESAGYFFYYPPAADTLKVTLHGSQLSLANVLEAAFVNTAYHYAIDASNNVFITYNRTILTELPPGFFDANGPGTDADFGALFSGGTSSNQQGSLSPESRLYEIGNRNARNGQQQANLAGHVTEAGSGEPVVGAVIYIESPPVAVTTDGFGYYSITLPIGHNEVKIRCLGMKNTRRQVMMAGEGRLEIEMHPDVIPLKEVVIESEKDLNVSGLQMGMSQLDIRSLRQVPSVLGETDVLKIALTLPGVQTVGESSTGLNVRGGATDQNLILFNGATIYNPSHLFGFFSAFNPDVLKGVELYKSGIPAEYGGRLSSILEVNTREGNRKKVQGAGGLGLITSRLALEGPLVKDKASFIVGARTTYSDWILARLPDKGLRNSRASFYDLNGHLSYDINERNSIYLTGYHSGDRFKLNSDTLYQYANRSAVGEWKHIFGNKFYAVIGASYSGYDYEVSSDRNFQNAFSLSFDISQVTFKADMNYFSSNKHTLNFGASTTRYGLKPGDFIPLGDGSLIRPRHVEHEVGLESAVYVGDQFEVSQRLSIYGGLRYSVFNSFGPKSVYTYSGSVPKSEESITDTIRYAAGEVMKTYQGPELRISARYSVGANASVKLSYNRMRQYVQRLSNTTAVSPTDIWKLSDRYVRPEICDQVAAGIYKNLRANTIEASAEVYFKWAKDMLDYKGGAELILNEHIETDVIHARGIAYGVELMLKKATGKLNGWLSYTFSRSLLKATSTFATETVNNGTFYPSSYDKPHDATLVGNYRFSRRFSTSLNVTYSTGRPVTLPLLKYEFRGAQRLYYSDRNHYRIPDYFRVDLAANVEGNHRIRKLAHSSWSIGIYNLTGRKNVYSVYFVSEGGVTRGYRLSIFGQAVPTVTYNFRF